MKYKYCVAECWGLGFIENNESTKFQISGFAGNIWQVPANNGDANLWVNKVAGVWKTKEEAQAIVDAEVLKAQEAWDLLPEEQKTIYNIQRPVDIILE